jgi:ABC-2 type transport system permease protein
MRKLLEITRHDLRIFLTDRGNLIGLLFTPILMTLIIGFVNGSNFSSGPSRIRVDVVDHDQSELSAKFVSAMRAANATLILCPMDSSQNESCRVNNGTSFGEGEVEERLLEGTTLAAVEIPAGFERALQAFEPVQITYLAKENFVAPSFIQQAVEAAIQRVNGAVVAARVGSAFLEKFTGDQFAPAQIRAELFTEASRLWEQDPVEVRFVQSGEPQGATAFESLQVGLGQSVPGMGSMFVMFTVFGAMTALVVERKEWTLQRLASMPISKAQLLGGKILARFSLGLLQFLVVFAVGMAIGMPLGESPLGLVLTAVAFTMAVTALSFALGSRLDNEQQASGFGLLLSLILAPLGGAWWPLSIVPEFMRVAGHISPIAWSMDAFTSLIFEGGGVNEILLPLAVLSGFSILAFALAVRNFRYA